MENFTKEELKNLFIGFAVIGMCLILTGIYEWQKNIWAGTEDTDYTVFATFNRTDGLVVGDHVRMAGVDVGRVIDSKLDSDFRATLTMSIDSDIKIPDDSSASIISSGLTGSKYIEIEPGGSDDFIAPQGEFLYTQDAMVLEELVDRLISIGKANRQKAAKSVEETKSVENNVTE